MSARGSCTGDIEQSWRRLRLRRDRRGPLAHGGGLRRANAVTESSSIAPAIVCAHVAARGRPAPPRLPRGVRRRPDAVPRDVTIDAVSTSGRLRARLVGRRDRGRRAARRRGLGLGLPRADRRDCRRGRGASRQRRAAVYGGAVLSVRTSGGGCGRLRWLWPPIWCSCWPCRRSLRHPGRPGRAARSPAARGGRTRREPRGRAGARARERAIACCSPLPSTTPSCNVPYGAGGFPVTTAVVSAARGGGRVRGDAVGRRVSDPRHRAARTSRPVWRGAARGVVRRGRGSRAGACAELAGGATVDGTPRPRPIPPPTTPEGDLMSVTLQLPAVSRSSRRPAHSRDARGDPRRRRRRRGGALPALDLRLRERAGTVRVCHLLRERRRRKFQGGFAAPPRRLRRRRGSPLASRECAGRPASFARTAGSWSVTS